MSENEAGGVRCPGCGRVYRWREELAGREARCRGCGGVVVMPADPPDAANDQAGQPTPLATPSDRCPSCGGQVKPGAVICVNCGYNMREGTRLQTAVGAPDAPPQEEPPDAPKAKQHESEGPPEPKSIKERLADRDDEVQPSTFIDVYLPLILLGLGFVVAVVKQIHFGDGDPLSLAAACILVAVGIAITVPLLLLGLYVAAWILDVSYGPLGIGLLKLTAIAVGPDAIGDIAGAAIGGVGGMFIGFFVAIAAYWALIAKLFDLDAMEAIETIILLWVVQLIAGFVAFLLVLSLFASAMP